MNISLSNQVASGDENDPIGDSVDLIENVAGNDQMHPLASEFFEERQRLRPSYGVKSIERLVKNKNLWMMSDRLREPYLLTHTFAVPGDLPSRRIAQTGAFKRFPGKPVSVRSARAHDRDDPDSWSSGFSAGARSRP